MKDSGVEWIGDIPKDWIRLSLRKALLCSITDGPHETPNYIDKGIPFVSIDSLNSSESVDLSIVRKFISDEDYERYNKKTQIQPGAVLFTKAATIGKTAIVGEEKYMVWSPIAVIKANTEIASAKFLYYILSTEKFVLYASLLGTNNTQINLGMRALEKANIPLPINVKEQESITKFLDNKVDSIDRLIEKTKSTIEEYKLLKQSTITEAVTKGLDKNVKMIDCNIMTVNSIPENWNIVILKRISYIRYGLGQPPPPSETGLPIIRATNIDAGKIIEKNLIYAKVDEVRTSKDVILSEGDLLVVRSGAYTGDIGYITEKWKGSLAGYDMIMTIINNNPKFIMYSFLSTYLLDNQIFLMRMRAAQPHLNAEELGSVRVILPSLSQQNEIVNYLDQKCFEIDLLVQQKNKLLNDLESYKKSLIYEYITGKREVL